MGYKITEYTSGMDTISNVEIVESKNDVIEFARECLHWSEEDSHSKYSIENVTFEEAIAMLKTMGVIVEESEGNRKMKFTRERMLESFEQLEMDLEGNLNNMKIYRAMNNKDLAALHKETFDAMYEDGYEA